MGLISTLCATHASDHERRICAMRSWMWLFIPSLLIRMEATYFSHTLGGKAIRLWAEFDGQRATCAETLSHVVWRSAETLHLPGSNKPLPWQRHGKRPHQEGDARIAGDAHMAVAKSRPSFSWASAWLDHERDERCSARLCRGT